MSFWHSDSTSLPSTARYVVRLLSCLSHTRLQETDHLTAGLMYKFGVHTCIDDGWSSIVITEQDIFVSPMHLPDVPDMYAVIDYDGVCTSRPL